MQLGGLVRGGGSGRARVAVLALLAIATLALVVLEPVPQARAVRVEVKPSFIEEFTGSDWVGKVTAFYGESDVFAISEIKFANLCNRRGSELTASITVNRHTKRFHYRGRGFTVSGSVIGKLTDPSEIVGLASVSRDGCQSGPWWFGVGAPPRYGAPASRRTPT